MNIKRLQLNQGAENAEGLTVIIDVFRAFTVACYLINNGAERIYPVASIDLAYRMKHENNALLLIGERSEKKCDGFDYGNSPSHIAEIDFSGKKIVHTTSSGTQGIALAKNASEIITGSFVNAGAIVNYIKQQRPAVVSLVSMGYEGLRPTQEDEFCADYIENELNGRQTNFHAMVETLRHGDGARLLDPKNNEHSPASDFDLCLQLNHFDFVLKVLTDEQGRHYIEKY
ncbi:MAG TPA: 2-phosphosulfolactate phosphatase [Prolixibacteraceae bacterium]|nr:2-phosphosulfolactate phosphatase [Prolixibacteraceae bacterium]